MSKCKKNSRNTNSLTDYLNKTSKQIRILESYLDWDPEQPDYKTKIKSMIKEKLAQSQYTSAADAIKIDYGEAFKMDSIYRKRRVDAFCKVTPEIAKKFKSKYPDVPLEYFIAVLSTTPDASMPDLLFGSTVNTPDASRTVTIAVALFILDELKRCEKLHKALCILPNKAAEIDEVDINDSMIFDASYPDNLIQSMVFLLEHYDDEKCVYLSHKSAQREHTGIVRANVPDVSFKDSEDVMAFYQEMHDLSYHERLDIIFSLIPQERIERAISQFESKLNDFLDISFEIMSKSWHVTFDSMKKMVEISKECINAENNMNDDLRKKVIMLKAAYHINKDIYIRGMDETATYIRSEMKATMTACHNKFMLAQAELQKNANYFNDLSYNIINNCCMDKVDYEDEQLKRFNSLSIEDPYEILFAYYYMAKHGYDLIWLVEPAVAVFNIATAHLPWVIPMNIEFREKANEVLSSEANEKHQRIDHPEWGKRFYQRRYTDYVDWSTLGIGDQSDGKLNRLNFPQLVFHATRVVLPRDLDYTNSETVEALMKSGMGKRTAPLMKLFLDTNASIAHRNMPLYELPPDDDDAKNDSEEISKLKSNIATQTDEISRLKSRLHAAEKEAQNLRNTIEQIRDDTAFEHEELIQLREVVYEMQNETGNDSMSDDTDISFPYTSKRNIVVFGGHATWLKNIRPLLPQVRFIEPQENPDVNMIRNADVVWMQTNAMPHAYYNKIMDIARQRKITIKYFAYGSAEKCAYQLAEDDM